MHQEDCIPPGWTVSISAQRPDPLNKVLEIFMNPPGPSVHT